ncbi:hypothetical protein EGR_03861 [Echinococcus granulosus]|uniref:Uncharacterized protein n=1 Tax=Echinococcus granulosus TaxID=6210 RepID=W6UIQ4_ECHGR|nr:hypothetical protein EGR_03861 [Echinococcus granulosus]EUB61375.1 hypothetical protein EGR_03861 [Echinococcus granulosus]
MKFVALSGGAMEKYRLNFLTNSNIYTPRVGKVLSFLRFCLSNDCGHSDEKRELIYGVFPPKFIQQTRFLYSIISLSTLQTTLNSILISHFLLFAIFCIHFRFYNTETGFLLSRNTKELTWLNKKRKLLTFLSALEPSLSLQELTWLNKKRKLLTFLSALEPSLSLQLILCILYFASLHSGFPGGLDKTFLFSSF